MFGHSDAMGCRSTPRRNPIRGPEGQLWLLDMRAVGALQCRQALLQTCNIISRQHRSAADDDPFASCDQAVAHHVAVRCDSHVLQEPHEPQPHRCVAGGILD